MSCAVCQQLEADLARLQRVLGRSRCREVVEIFAACVRDLEGRVRAHELEHAAARATQNRTDASRAEQAAIDRRR